MRKLVLGVLVVVLLSACGVGAGPIADPDPTPPVELTAADLAGVWRNESRDGTLFFAEDGTFRATNLPPEAFEGEDGQLLAPSFDKAHDRLDGRGKWRWRLDRMSTSDAP